MRAENPFYFKVPSGWMGRTACYDCFSAMGGLYTGWRLHFKMNGKCKIVFYLSSEVNIATISLLC